ncbi:MAG: SAM-dependent methyltransferase [Methanobacteriaceae archaeon]
MVSIILIFIVIVAVSMLWPLIIGAAYSPSSKEVVRKMLEMAEVDSDDVVYDLGSGDGRIVMEAAMSYKARAVGVEADPLRVIWSKILITANGLQNQIRIIWGNLFHQNIKDATVVTVFLWQRTNEKLKKKLLEELRPGTRVVSYVWTFEGWKPIKVDTKDRIYLYIIGESDLDKE